MVSSLTRWGPTCSRFGSLDHLLNDFFRPTSEATSTWYAPISIWEDEDHFSVEVDLPGVQNDDIDVTVEKDVLQVTAECKPPEDERTYLHLERRYGKFERAVSLPDTIDCGSVEAELKDGILHIKLAKKPVTQPKKISVKSA